jgi:hypothetical protein
MRMGGNQRRLFVGWGNSLSDKERLLGSVSSSSNERVSAEQGPELVLFRPLIVVVVVVRSTLSNSS